MGGVLGMVAAGSECGIELGGDMFGVDRPGKGACEGG